MNREQIIQIAREVGFQCLLPSEHTAATGCIYDSGDDEITSLLEAFAKLVAEHERNRTWTQAHWTEYERAIVAQEREACAEVAKTISDKYGWGHYGNEVDTADEIEAAIRARGQA